jgi:hypothetical protein
MFVRFSRLAILFEIKSAFSSMTSALFLILTILLEIASALLSVSTMSLAILLVWQNWLWSFHGRDTKLERVLAKHQV